MSEQVTPDVIEGLRKYDSATVSNAIEHFEVRDPTTGFANNKLVCQTSEVESPMVGFAVTATVDTTTPGDTRTSRVDDAVQFMADAPKPFVFVIQHVGHERRRACMIGDMFCSIIHRLGGVGAVTDCNARDRRGIRQRVPDFHLFTTGWVVSHGYGAYIDFNTTVSICGLTISPGDLLHGDASGLVSVPAKIAPQVVERAGEVVEIEREYFQFLDSDGFSMEELKRRIVPHE